MWARIGFDYHIRDLSASVGHLKPKTSLTAKSIFGRVKAFVRRNFSFGVATRMVAVGC